MLKKCLLIIFVVFLSVSCQDKNEYDITDSRYTSLSEQLEIFAEWKDAVVMIEERSTSASSHKIMEALDDDYKILRIDSENYDHDLIIAVFRIRKWNEHASEVTDGNINDIQPILFFDEKYVYSIDKDAYDQSISGYDEITELLLKLYYTDFPRDDYRETAGVSFETENAIYDKDTETIKVKWANITEDSFFIRDKYYIEKIESGNINEVVNSNINKSLLLEDETRNQELFLDCSKLDEGYYRIGIEFERTTLLGLEYNNPSKYIIYREFQIGEENVSRNNRNLSS
jgi:hypothetical protein